MTRFLFVVVSLLLIPGWGAASAAAEPFRPEAGKFPLLEKAHSYRDELIFVDHANRRGSLRVEGTHVEGTRGGTWRGQASFTRVEGTYPRGGAWRGQASFTETTRIPSPCSRMASCVITAHRRICAIFLSAR